MGRGVGGGGEAGIHVGTSAVSHVSGTGTGEDRVSATSQTNDGGIPGGKDVGAENRAAADQAGTNDRAEN